MNKKKGGNMNECIARWECKKCGKLLGTYKNGIVCIQIKGHQYTVENGRIQTVCPRCRTLNIILIKQVNRRKELIVI
jgi:phage FluMu protein Com